MPMHLQPVFEKVSSFWIHCIPCHDFNFHDSFILPCKATGLPKENIIFVRTVDGSDPADCQTILILRERERFAAKRLGTLPNF